jgi:outer membrane protein assembly factor BamB
MKMKRIYQFAVVGALGMCVSSMASASSWLLSDGVAIDNEVIYSMKPGGGVEALKAADGSVVWTSTDADRPVQVQDGFVLAQRESDKSGELLLRFLDTASGTVKASRALALPDDVVARIDEKIDHRFSLSVPADTPSELVWRFERRPPQGMLGRVDGPPTTRTAGRLQTDFATRNVVAATVPAPEPRRYDRVANVDFGVAGGRAFYSEDRQHVLVSRRLDNRRGYQWYVHDAQGVLLGKWSSRVSYAPFLVRQGHALFLSTPGARIEGDVVKSTGLELVAMHLARGEQSWARAVRDTRYRGPMAP